MFKRDKIFKQFVPLIQNFKQLQLPKSFPIIGGIVRVYQTDWTKERAKTISFNLGLRTVAENDKAAKYFKIDRGYDVFLIYNKEDKSILIAVSRIRH